MRTLKLAGMLLVLMGGAGQSLAQDGGSPHRGGTFISPMGEPFRAGADGRAPDLIWFEGADRDHDGHITLAEMRADAVRFFRTLDVNHDGEIDPDEITRYETEIAPEIAVGSSFDDGAEHRGGGGRGGRGGGGGHGGRSGGGGGFGGGGGGGGHRGGGAPGGDGADSGTGGARSGGGMAMGRRGAARFSYLGLAEPVTSADADFNRGVSVAEFDRAAIQRFGLLDTEHAGFLTRAGLPRLTGGRGDAEQRRRPPDAGEGQEPPQ